MIKYAANAFLATKISFANEVRHLCELVGADARHVLPAIGADRRIGSRFLSAGRGVGRLLLRQRCGRPRRDRASSTAISLGLLRATVAVNEAQRAAVLRKLQRELKVLKGRRVALLGLAFKPDTDDLRDAPSLDIADRLLNRGAPGLRLRPRGEGLPDGVARCASGRTPTTPPSEQTRWCS